MLVDAQGNFLTQRSHPRMALIRPQIKAEILEVRAPGMSALEIPLKLPDPEQAPTLNVRVWNDMLNAYECDDATSAWFSTFLDLPCRLARFHPHAQRSANTRWTGGLKVPTRFADGYPMLVISEASLADVNDRLKAQARTPLPMNRFRPNLVIDGLDVFEEDYAESFTINGVILKPVKPCPRCPILSIDQATGAFGPDPLDILRTYRADSKVDGGITFRMNTILIEGEGKVLHTGQEVEVSLAF